MRALVRAAVLAASAVVVLASSTRARAEEKEKGTAVAAPRLRPRFHIQGFGSVPTAAWALSQERTIREFAEDGRLRTTYAAGRKPGYEVGAQFDLLRRWGLAVGFSGQDRDARATYEATLPHPLYLDVGGAPGLPGARRVEGELPGLAYREQVAHFDVVHTIPGARLDVTLFAGTSHVSISAELLRAIEYRHEYPFDEVTVTGTPVVRPSGSALGFNVGGGLAYRFNRRLALALQARYAQAKVQLLPVPDAPLDIDAGGLAASLGARIGF